MNMHFFNKTISKVKLIAFILFLVNQLQNFFIGVAINFFGVYDFTATNYWNRIYGLFILAVLVYSIRIPKYLSKNRIIIYFLFFCLCIYGLKRNSFSDFIADLILLTLPFVFYIFFKKICKKQNDYLLEFISTYYRLNTYLIIPVVFLRLLNFKILNIDFNFLICYSIAQIVIKDEPYIYINKIKVYKNLFLSIIAGIGKVIIAQAVFFFAIRSFSVKRIHYFVFIVLLMFVSLKFIEKYGDKLITITANAGSLPRGIDLIQKTDFTEMAKLGFGNFNYLVNDPVLIFTLTDPSTGQRFFELFTAISTVNNSLFTKLFGLGIGGTLDQSETKDGSIASSHADISKVRVMHLMPTFLIAKFGYILALFIFMSLMYYIIKAIKVFRENNAYNFIALIGAVGIFFYFIGAIFTIGLFLKDFMLGFYIYCFSINFNKNSLPKEENF